MFREATVVFSLLTCVTAYAAEEVLDFKLVVMPIIPNVLEAANVPGQVVVAQKMKGAAFFKDGRVAAKDFIFTADYNKGTGPFFGYSTYMFEDGSSIVARFEGKSESGKPTHGEYTVLSGTGKYQGARGTGSFDAVQHKFEGGTLLMNGSFKLTTQ